MNTKERKEKREIEQRWKKEEKSSYVLLCLYTSYATKLYFLWSIDRADIERLRMSVCLCHIVSIIVHITHTVKRKRKWKKNETEKERKNERKKKSCSSCIVKSPLTSFV